MTRTRLHRSRIRRSLATLALAAACAAPAAAQLSSYRPRLLVEDTVVLLSRPEADDGFGAAFAAGDFDGDGVDDLATAIPGENWFGGVADAGAVAVRYGIAGIGLAVGLVVDDDLLAQWWSGSPDPAEPGDSFGGFFQPGGPEWHTAAAALAAGDFNGDGYADLAVGVPYEDVGGDSNAGAVQVHYGSATGIWNVGECFVHQDLPGVAGESETADQFGYALAAADFDGDGYADLAIGVPFEDVGVISYNEGMVQVLYGGPTGIATARSRHFDQDVAYDGIPMEGDAETFDRFGLALASGDLDGDGYADLAIGVPGEDDGAGSVAVVYGSAAGLRTLGNQHLHQNTPGVEDASEADDLFALSLAIGDFTSDGYDDLVVGVPYEDLPSGAGAAVDAGAVHFFYGSASGLAGASSYFMTSSATGVGVSESGDRWGTALVAGDFDADGWADLALGAPGEHVFGDRDGEVVVAYGHPPASPPFLQVWHQDIPGVPETQEPGDRFGSALAVGDFDGTGHDELVVGAPFESIVAGLQGAAWVLHGSLFADGFAGGDTSGWSAAVP